jgi:hypothetical protein
LLYDCRFNVWGQCRFASAPRFLGEAAHRAEAEIDRAGRQLSRFQMDTIPENDALAERKPRFRAIPLDEFVNGVPVSSLSIRELRLFRTADLGWSRSGSRNTVLGTRRPRFSECLFAIRRGLQSRRQMMASR